MRIGIIGLGLIGGSLALALRAAPRAGETLWAVDLDPATRADALDANAVDAAYASLDEAPLEQADLLFLCLHPEACAALLARIAPRLKPGAVVTDVCGVKQSVMQAAREALPEQVSFIGGHPMAGKEKGGFAHATPTLFHRAHYLLTPAPGAPEQAVALLRDVALRIGCADVVRTTPEAHDLHIAYTSQMMHVLALAICEQSPFDTSRGYEGGSFRGATRVAALDASLWTELFWDNRALLADLVGELAEKLKEYEALLRGEDREALSARLRATAAKKEAWDRAERGRSGR